MATVGVESGDSWPVVWSMAYWNTWLVLRLATYRYVPAGLTASPSGVVPAAMVGVGSGTRRPSERMRNWPTMPVLR